MKKLKRIISNNLFMIKYVFKYMPLYIFIKIFVAFLNGVVSPYILFNTLNNLYTQVESQLASNSSDFKPILIQFGILVGITLIQVIFSIFFIHFYFSIKIPRFIEKMKDVIYERSREVEISKYENPEFYDDFVWSFEYATSMPFKVVSAVTNLLKVFLTIITVSTFLFKLDVISGAFVIIVSVTGIIAKSLTAKNEFKKDEELTPVNRELNYINRIMSLDTFAKELRMNKIEELLIGKYDKVTDKHINISIKHIRNIFWIDYTSALISDITLNVVFYLYMAFKILVLKTFQISGMMTVLPAITETSANIKELFFTMVDFSKNSKYIEKLRNFIEYEPQIKDPENAKEISEPMSVIEFKNISFNYESNPEVMALNNISMQIHKNEKIAIVGYNGAGKSTLIKLLLRLYEPTDGRIYLNGTEITKYKIENYRALFGTVFQDFRLFSVTLAENVKMDILDRTPEEERKITEALEKANFGEKLSQLPEGIYTQLGREFDEKGVILSGGEAQKVAIARAIMQDSEIVIMDEPSSALDPNSEYELNKLMMNSTYDKTVIFISHRLSTTRMADKIYMMENGHIIEEGSHDELIKLNGKYAEMFNKQAEKYLQQ